MSAAFSPLQPLTLREATQALCCISADLVRDDWVMIAAAMHNEFGDAAFTEFDQWSATGTSYSPQAARDTWRSCRKLTRYGMGSLIALAKKHGYRASIRYPVTPSAQAAIDRARMESQKDRDARSATLDREREARQARAARIALDRWEHGSTTEPGTHPYLVRKHIDACGARRGLCEDAEIAPLLVPLRSADGTLQGLQEIYSDGSKKFPYGTAKTGHFHAFGVPLDRAGRAFVGEGFGTMASFAQYSEYSDAALIVGFDKGNLKPVAVALRAKYPDLQIIIAADWDTFKDGDGGDGYRFACAAAIEVDGEVVHPEPISGSSKTDFSDWHLLQCERHEMEAA